MMGDRDKRDEQSRYQRECIATAAMAAILTATGSDWRYMDSDDVEDIAFAATRHADALIKELHSGS